MAEGVALVDLESGTDTLVSELQCELGNGIMNNEDGSSDERIRRSNSSSSISTDSAVGYEKRKSKVNVGTWDSPNNGKPKEIQSKRPPKPPRPPTRSLSLDVIDQRLIKELSELTKLKKARAERIARLKRIKNARSAPSGGSLIAIIITLSFCLIIIWQGIHK